MYNYNSYAPYGTYAASATTSNPQAALSGLYSNYPNFTAASQGYSQVPASSANSIPLGQNLYGYDYTAAYKAPSAENPYTVSAGRLPSAPVGFTSAGNLHTTPGTNLAGFTAATVNQSATPGVAAGTHYEGYDAAVLAAASSYIVSKSNGFGNDWLSMKNPRPHPDATFPNKKRAGVGHHPHHRNIPRDTQSVFCDVCKISCAGQNAYQDHLKGKNHKKKEAMVTGKNQIALPKNKILFRCEVCEIVLTGKDTYDAHAKGSRHQKTLALLRKMGKPLPSTDPVVIAPHEMTAPAPIPTVGSQSAPKAKVIGVSTTRFVSGSNLSTTDDNGDQNGQNDKEVVDAILEAEAQIQPVGQEYVDSKFDDRGKLLEYTCRLCECSFTDPNALGVHTKGRRHRLAYKSKVDPSLKVEMKGSIVARHRRDRRSVNAPPPPDFVPPMPSHHEWMDMDNSVFACGHESPDDKHVLKKYDEIKMDDAQVEGLSRLVEAVETALKSVSDKITEEDFTGQNPAVITAEEKNPEVEGEAKESVTPPEKAERILRGSMKVGLLAHGILKKDDTLVDIVVLCHCIPTKRGLNKIVELLPDNFDAAYKETLTLTTNFDHAGFLIEVGGFDVKVRITLTSPIMRQYEGKANEAKAHKELTSDSLPLAPCLAALAELRRAKWYQAKAAPMEGMNITMIVLRDIRQRVHTWEPLTSWILSMLVQNVLESFGQPMTPGDALRRVFEAIASAIILSKRAILYDPCEKEKVDVFEHLTSQQREDITSSAQHALRLIIFDHLHQILGMDKLDESKPNIRKRPLGNDENVSNGEEVELKKEKPSMD